MTEPMDKTLAGKGAVVTGAGRGIGRAIALGYARAGASICCAARTETEIQETVREIRDGGWDCGRVQADVRQQGPRCRGFSILRKRNSAELTLQSSMRG